MRFFLKPVLVLILLTSFVGGLVYYNAPRPVLLQGTPFGKAILDRDGNLLRLSLASDDKYRLFTPLAEINPHAIQAVLFYEDRKFYEHGGIDFFALLRSCWSNLTGKRKMGASTISMQVARLSRHLNSSCWTGKLLQIFHAILLERYYSKSEILEAYFNLAPYGANIEGIATAARIYFNSSPAGLTESECLALASVPQNPVARFPVNGRDFENARKRLWRAMQKEGEPAPLLVRSPADLPFSAPHLSMELSADAQEGVIKTTIDAGLQRMLESVIAQYLERHQRYGIKNAAAMLVDGKSFEVAALAGSASFFDNSIGGQIDGSRIRRSPGSTLKPFIYALALEQGLIHPLSILTDAPKSFGGYDPQNFDQGFMGPVSAELALRNSRNLPAITLSEQLAAGGLFGFLTKAGVKFPHDAAYYGLSIVLGGAEISMRELARLYAMLLNQGYIRNLQTSFSDSKQAPTRVLSREAAWLALRMLEREDAYVISQGRKIPLLYKTGTSNGFRDAWTSGIIGQYALVVWIGNFDNSANPLFVGAKTALPLFGEIASALAMKEKLYDISESPGEDYNLVEVEICATTGDFELAHCPRKSRSWIIPGVSPVASRRILRPVLIDKATGLRACRKDSKSNDEIWLEFWPTEMMKIFEQAGINKPVPPDWLPECVKGKSQYLSQKPDIILPKKNVTYHKRMSDAYFRLPLKASADAETKKVFWYADNEFLGSSRPGETFFWHPSKAGSPIIRAVDENGRVAMQKCRLEVLP